MIMELIYNNIKYAMTYYPIEYQTFNDLFALNYNYRKYTDYAKHGTPNMISIWPSRKEPDNIKYLQIFNQTCKSNIVFFGRTWLASFRQPGVYHATYYPIINLSNPPNHFKLKVDLLTLILGFNIIEGGSSFELTRSKSIF